jgi:hypothetical protein
MVPLRPQFRWLALIWNEQIVEVTVIAGATLMYLGARWRNGYLLVLGGVLGLPMMSLLLFGVAVVPVVDFVRDIVRRK